MKEVSTVAEIRVVWPQGREDGPFDLGVILHEGDDLATMDDATIMHRVAEHLDVADETMTGMDLFKSEVTGNMVIKEAATFAGEVGRVKG